MKNCAVVLFGDISRRDFMKYCAGTAAVLGLSELELFSKVSEALAASSAKPPVIWLEGQDCAGCTISFAGALNPPVSSLILDKLSIRYHETLMAGAGYLAEATYEETVKAGGYVLCIEGSIPTADDRYCMVGGRPFREMVEEAGEKAAAIIAVGACAAYGGIPAAGPTGAVGANKIIKNKPIINLPTCPVHVDHLVGTILYFLTSAHPEMAEFQELQQRLLRLRCNNSAPGLAHGWVMLQLGAPGPNLDTSVPLSYLLSHSIR